MGILYEATSNRHAGCCRPPSNFSVKNMDGYWWSTLPKNSVWQCDECGKSYVSRGFEACLEWKRVKWYHLKALSIINKEKRKEGL